MDAAAEGSIELQDMDISKEVHEQDGEERVTRTAMLASLSKNSVKLDCTMHAVAEVRIELPEMDTGKEVHVQDGEEHVICSSMAASEMNGNVGIEKQGEESEEGMSPEAGASSLHPLVIDESESDTESQTWINHPSSSPEGSRQHALYFHLVDAGFDLCSKAFGVPAAALDEPEESEEMHRQSMSDTQIMPLNSREGNHDDDSDGEQTQQQMRAMTVGDIISRGPLFRRAFGVPATALHETEESEEMHRQSMSDMQIMPLNSREGNRDDGSDEELSQQQMRAMTVGDIISRGPLFRRAFGVPAHAAALNELEGSEEMHGQSMSDMQIMPLNSREGNHDDDSDREQTQQQMRAMTVHDILCRARSRAYDSIHSLANIPTLGDMMCRAWSRAYDSIHSVADPENEFEEMHRQSMSDMQIMPLNSREGNQADGSNGEQLQQQMPPMTLYDWIHSLAESENKLEEMQQQIMGNMQMPPWIGNQADGSNGDQIPQQMPKTAPKKRRGAAKKTAANADPSQLQGPNSTPPTCPRPLHIGVRKNAPMKKNKGYLKNRLQ